MKSKYPKIAPDKIETLSMCEVFVFGSNLQGHHTGGAARYAYKHFGAEWGVGIGPTGQCYAIPTMHGGVDDIRPYVEDFVKYAKTHPLNRFLLTRIGCGIAGFSDKQMAMLFYDAGASDLPNVASPEKWIVWYATFASIDQCSSMSEPNVPEVLTDDVLRELCREYLYQIGVGIRTGLPSVRIRYVLDDNKFGYAYFGQFFFYGDQLYVWDRNEIWKDTHNQGVVVDTFHDECDGRGYAHPVIFAGVCTNLKDIHGDYIYTGDVVRTDKLHDSLLGVQAINYPEEYGIILDNHSLPLKECQQIERMGTVFYNLVKDTFQPDIIRERCNDLLNLYGPRLPFEEVHRHIRFTPNFYTDEWQYIAMEKLRDEDFDWR